MRYMIIYLTDHDEWWTFDTESGKPMSFETAHDARLALTVLQHAWKAGIPDASRFRIVEAGQ